MNDKKLTSLFEIQKDFNDIFFDLDKLTLKDKEEITKSLCIALHTEVSEIVSGVNFKDHRIEKKEPDINKILYESVDALRYIISILNLWQIDSQRFIDAFMDKDLLLQTRHRLNSNKWDGRPVIIVDMDDVITKFRKGFLEWLSEVHGVKVNKKSKEYYTSKEVKKAGLNPEHIFFDFINQRKMKTLEPDVGIIDAINRLHDEGFWIHILTARPKENVICHYDTYFWLENSNLKY